MGCLTVTYRRTGAVSVSLEKVGGQLACYAGRMPKGVGGSFDMSFDLSFAISYICLVGWVSRVGSELACTARRKGGLEASIALVCDTGLTQYVRVEPKYVWLVPELDFTADTEVFSNVEWNVT